MSARIARSRKKPIKSERRERLRKRHREAQRRYQQSCKGRETQRRYQQSPLDVKSNAVISNHLKGAKLAGSMTNHPKGAKPSGSTTKLPLDGTISANGRSNIENPINTENGNSIGIGAAPRRCIANCARPSILIRFCSSNIIACWSFWTETRRADWHRSKGHGRQTDQVPPDQRFFFLVKSFFLVNCGSSSRSIKLFVACKIGRVSLSIKHCG